MRVPVDAERTPLLQSRQAAAGWVKMRASGEIPDMPGMANHVISRRWKAGKGDGFEVVGGSLTDFVRKRKRRQGKDIYLGGGGELARSFLKEDWVDEPSSGLVCADRAAHYSDDYYDPVAV